MVRAIRDCGLVPLGGVTDISGPLSLAHAGGGAGGEDFAAIASALEGAGCVLKYLNGLDETLDLLAEFTRHVDRFDDELEAIRAIVGPDASIRDDASPRLSELRRRITATTQEIHDVIHGYLRQPEVAKLLQSATVTLHGDRYVLPVKVENRGGRRE
jgi:DNA mismatch repair protein MutS2